MRLVSIVLMLLLAGCDRVLGLERPIDGAPPADVAIDVAIDAPVDAAPIGHDEDGDGRDDALDNCPADSNSDQDDGDTDGVGDVCDPHPTLAIDRIAYFNGFQTAFGPEWIRVQGTWVHAPDQVRQAAVVTENQIALLETTLVDPTIQVVVATVLDGTHAEDQGAFIATGTVAGGPLPDGVACYELIASSQLEAFDNRTPPGTAGPPAALPLGPWPARIVLQSSTEDTGAPTGRVACSANYVDMPITTITTANPAPIASGKVALYTYNGRATFYSVTVYDRLP